MIEAKPSELTLMVRKHGSAYTVVEHYWTPDGPFNMAHRNHGPYRTLKEAFVKKFQVAGHPNLATVGIVKTFRKSDGSIAMCAEHAIGRDETRGFPEEAVEEESECS